MRIKAFLVLGLWTAVLCPAFAQMEWLGEAIREFSTSQLWEFEPLAVDWKMNPALQADFNEGLNNLLEDRAAMAEENLTVVIGKDPAAWQAYYFRAAARKEQRKLKVAREDLQKALKLHDNFYEGLVELAKVEYLQRQVAESEQTINKAIRLDRSRGTAYYLKGDINLAQQQLRPAINSYRDCLAADSLYHDARIKLALLDAFEKRDMTKALAHLNKVLKNDSLQRTALLFRSMLGREKNIRQSIKDLSILIRLRPDDLMARYYHGLFLTDVGDYESAFNDFQVVITRTNIGDNQFDGKQTNIDKFINVQNVGAYILRRVYGLPDTAAARIKESFCLLLTEKHDKGIAALEQVPDGMKEPSVVYLKAVTYEHKGQHPKALQYYGIALGLDDKLVDAYKKRGIYRQEMKQWALSVEDFTTYLKLFPDGYYIHRIRGVSYYYLDRYPEAIADYTAYLKKDSSNVEVLGNRGMAYQKSRQWIEAYVDFAASGNIHAVDFFRVEKIVDSVLHAKDTTRALFYLDTFVKASPQFTEGYVQKFKIHMARKEWAPVSAEIGLALIYARSDAPKSARSYIMTLTALVQARSSDTSEAVKSLNEAIKLDLKNDFAYLERGRIYLAQGKTSKAASDFKEASALGNEQARQLLASMAK
ncbi:tetratricopeptide repeat protein [Dawidia soli]|uniref:Tetratricopeptide repeat protein n=1 Tax=Dawidia soli TaxID=2782352 RepID=A0AAP2GH28_9BACT|nr:tetratricopeptide repeat protein [Dawidia soli]MBT1686000.1 tetratricopeptide repeat protein [Dawidia soli]